MEIIKQENQYLSAEQAANAIGISRFKFDQSFIRGLIKPSIRIKESGEVLFSKEYVLDLKKQVEANPRFFNAPKKIIFDKKERKKREDNVGNGNIQIDSTKCSCLHTSMCNKNFQQ